MAAVTTTIAVKYQRRQAMLSIREPVYSTANGICIGDEEVARVPVLVWPMPTQEGLFVVEHQDGTAQMVHPDLLTFLRSKEIFDQYDWTNND